LRRDDRREIGRRRSGGVHSANRRQSVHAMEIAIAMPARSTAGQVNRNGRGM